MSDPAASSGVGASRPARDLVREYRWRGGALRLEYEVGIRVTTLLDEEVQPLGALPPGPGSPPGQRREEPGDEGIGRWESEGGR